jgi:hypothetical protein
VFWAKPIPAQPSPIGPLRNPNPRASSINRGAHLEIFHSHPSLFPGRHFLLPCLLLPRAGVLPRQQQPAQELQGRQQKLHGRRAPFHGRASLPPAHRSTSLRSASLTRRPCSRRAQLHLPVLSSSPCPAPLLLPGRAPPWLAIPFLGAPWLLV